MLIFWTRLKTLFRRKETLFWILLFPILLASAEYLAFGGFINSTPIETITVGTIEEGDYKLPELYNNVLENAELEDGKALFEIHNYKSTNKALEALKENEVSLLIYSSDEEVTIEALYNSISLTVATSVIEQTKSVENVIKEAYANYLSDLMAGKNPVKPNEEQIINNLLADISYIKDESTNKNATFYTIYFYALIAMAAMYAGLFGLSIINDLRADRSSLGIRISTSVASKAKLISIYFLTAALLEFISSVVLFMYLRYVLRVSLGNNVPLIFVTLALGGIAGLSLGMLVAACVKGSYKKCEGVVNAITLTLCIFAGLMSVDVKHFADNYIPWLNYINPASLITNSLYALYYYSNFNNYIIYTCCLAAFIILSLAIVIFKTRGEKYASL